MDRNRIRPFVFLVGVVGSTALVVYMAYSFLSGKKAIAAGEV
eukprot:CAMPEP_0113970546 /NCGR_PEP_ID=MMETSP0011_2-20120614/11294_1 /TAXON_ID=101924 /ORGANISM="Rhodosorus marinus" /LENGTH=41 /DNA_ID=CAMNT_0000985049 /DNA_START=115 /DNA_END=237 /DNA_ORIENTATION=+ /assembly_acc=CAM_ASM_000156